MLNKNDWYYKSKLQDSLEKEAGFGNNMKKAVLAVALILSGASFFTACQRSGLSQSEVEQALNDQSMVELAKMSSELTEFSTVNMPNAPEAPQVQEPAQEVQEDIGPHGLPTAINYSEIQRTVRLYEVSGQSRIVTIGGEQVDIRKVYKDPIKGWEVPTIGVGCNLNRSDARALIEGFGLNYSLVRSGKQMLTDAQVNSLFDNDLQNAIADAKSFLPNFDDQPTDVKTIVSDMSFNLGLTRLSGFNNFRAALTEFDFATAADEMVDSDWYGQTGNRSRSHVAKMRSINNN
jgi:hypothetical protein